MEQKKYFFTVAIISAFFSCTTNTIYAPDKLVMLEKQLPTDTLKCDSIYLGLGVDTLDYYMCFQTNFLGPYVIQATFSDKHRFQMCDLRNPEKLVFFAPKGRAMDEFVLMPEKLNIEITADSSMLVYGTDYGKNKVVCVDALASFREEKCIVRKTYDIPEKGGVESFYPYYSSNSDVYIVGYQAWSYTDLRDNIFFPPKFILNGADGEKDKIIYPDLIDNAILTTVDLAYRSIVRMSPDRTKIVEALAFCDITNVLDINSGRVLGIVRNDKSSGFEYYEHSNSVEFYANNYRQHNASIALSNDKIFRIWKQGCLMSEITDNLPILEVLTYEGELLGSFFLENYYCSISYSDYYDCLFAVGEQNVLYKYELPQWLKKN